MAGNVLVAGIWVELILGVGNREEWIMEVVSMVALMGVVVYRTRYKTEAGNMVALIVMVSMVALMGVMSMKESMMVVAMANMNWMGMGSKMLSGKPGTRLKHPMVILSFWKKNFLHPT